MPAGRSGRRWHKLKAEVYARRAPCCRCGQRIDYTRPYVDPVTGQPDPEAKSVDHYPFPLDTHPQLAEDPSNLAAAHLRCNQSAGKRGVQATYDLGVTSRAW